MKTPMEKAIVAGEILGQMLKEIPAQYHVDLTEGLENTDNAVTSGERPTLQGRAAIRTVVKDLVA